MKFSLIGPAYPLRGGIAHHVYWLSQTLVERGHTPQVISFCKLYPDFLFPGRTMQDASQLKLDAGAEPLLDALNPFTWLRALRAVRRFAPEVVVMEWWHPFFAPVFGTLAAGLKACGIRCVMECHNVFPHEPSLLDLPLLGYAFAPIRRFITHSQSDREALIHLFDDKTVSIAPLPVINELASLSQASRSGRTILFFGLVRPYKGLDILLNALPQVRAQVDCRLLIVGEFYDAEEKYRALARQLGIEQIVQIENRYLPNEEVPELLARADVLVLPYRSATQSGVARMALASGLPLIAARVGGLAEVVEEGVNGLLFSPGDAKQLAERLVYYFSTNCGERFAANLRAAAREARTPKLIELIEEFAAKP